MSRTNCLILFAFLNIKSCSKLENKINENINEKHSDREKINKRNDAKSMCDNLTGSQDILENIGFVDTPAFLYDISKEYNNSGNAEELQQNYNIVNQPENVEASCDILDNKDLETKQQYKDVIEAMQTEFGQNILHLMYEQTTLEGNKIDLNASSTRPHLMNDLLVDSGQPFALNNINNNFTFINSESLNLQNTTFNKNFEQNVFSRNDFNQGSSEQVKIDDINCELVDHQQDPNRQVNYSRTYFTQNNLNQNNQYSSFQGQITDNFSDVEKPEVLCTLETDFDSKLSNQKVRLRNSHNPKTKIIKTRENSNENVVKFAGSSNRSKKLDLQSFERNITNENILQGEYQFLPSKIRMLPQISSKGQIMHIKKVTKPSSKRNRINTLENEKSHLDIITEAYVIDIPTTIDDVSRVEKAASTFCQKVKHCKLQIVKNNKPVNDIQVKDQRKDRSMRAIKKALYKKIHRYNALALTQIPLYFFRISYSETEYSHKNHVEINNNHNVVLQNFYDHELLTFKAKKITETYHFTYNKNKFEIQPIKEIILQMEALDKNFRLSKEKLKCCEVLQSSEIYNIYQFDIEKSEKHKSKNFTSSNMPGNNHFPHQNVKENKNCYYQFKNAQMIKIFKNIFESGIATIFDLSKSKTNVPSDLGLAKMPNYIHKKESFAVLNIEVLSETISKNLNDNHFVSCAFFSSFIMNIPNFDAYKDLFLLDYKSDNKIIAKYLEENMSSRINLIPIDLKLNLITDTKRLNEINSSYQILNINKLLNVHQYKLENEIFERNMYLAKSEEVEIKKIATIYEKFVNIIEEHVFQCKHYKEELINQNINNLFLFMPELIFYIHLKRKKIENAILDPLKSINFNKKEVLYIEKVLHNYSEHCINEFKEQTLDALNKSIFDLRSHICKNEELILNLSQKYLYSYAIKLKYSEKNLDGTENRVKISFLIFILIFTLDFPTVDLKIVRFFSRNNDVDKYSVFTYVGGLFKIKEVSRAFSLTLHLVLMFLRSNMVRFKGVFWNIPIFYPFVSSHLIISDCPNCSNLIWTHSHTRDSYKFFFDQFIKLMT